MCSPCLKLLIEVIFVKKKQKLVLTAGSILGPLAPQASVLPTTRPHNLGNAKIKLKDGKTKNKWHRKRIKYNTTNNSNNDPNSVASFQATQWTGHKNTNYVGPNPKNQQRSLRVSQTQTMVKS